MAKEGPAREAMTPPDFEETDAGGKSSVSLITDEVKNEKIQAKPTIANFYRIITNHYGQLIHMNEMTGKPERYDMATKRWREFTDADEADMRSYFENEYGMYSQNKMQDALQVYFANNRVNPLLQILEGLEWDGKPRIEHFLHDVMKVEDSEYTREASRLIFAGGIHRAYEPGCKFDDMIVLIGTQGTGKTTITRWLNMEDRFYQEIKTISGKEGIEAIRGVWIGEVSELMAMTRVKEAEAVKAYITSQKDNYRPPYAKHTQTIPRRCIFIGTTNNPQFLTDKTGNRRFYPVKVNVDGYKLLDNEKDVREYIAQAWAEAVHLYKKGKLQPFAKREVLEQIRAAQEAAMEDDWRIGAIEQYLADTKKRPNDTVSIIELWHRALNEPEESKPTRSDSIAITQIITNIPGWVKCDNPIHTQWGKQKAFRKVNPFFPSWR